MAPDDLTIVHAEPDPEHASVTESGMVVPAFRTRVEKLRKLAVMAQVDAKYLDGDGAEGAVHLLMSDLQHRLRRLMETNGRVAHGEVTINRHQDHLRDRWVYRAEVLTRESQEEPWPSVYKALREDGLWE